MAKSPSLTLQDLARCRDSFRQQAIQTNNLRAGGALFRNIEHLAAVFGESFIGDMTLTFRDSPDPYTAVKRLKKLLRKFKKLFRAYIWVMEFGPAGNLHFHVAVVCTQDIRAGFDVVAYDTLKALSLQCRAEHREMSPHETVLANGLKRSLKVNPALKAIQRDVRKLLSSKNCKFGFHFELTPIRKTPEDLGAYYRKNYFAAVRARHGRYPGVHLTGSSRTCPRIWNSNFALVDSQARFNYKAIAEALDIPDMPGMTERFGRRWSMALEPVIDELRIWISKDLQG